MKTISEVRACVVDSGLFPHIATCLAEQMDHVYYCGPRDGFMPKLADAIVGSGFDNITRVREVWSVKEHCDVFVYTDIGLAAEQAELREQGYPVWGHQGADVLEYDKGFFLGTLKQLGMDIPPYRIIQGEEALFDYLENEEDKYIKISRFRGDWETFHWRNYLLDGIPLAKMVNGLGPVAKFIRFYVFDPIDTKIEDGIDTWCIDGQWPKRVFHGMERKDKSFLGAIQDFDSIAEAVRHVNDLFGPVLAEYGYRGAFSTEVRLNESSFFIDPTCRFGSPPSQLQTVLIKNLPEIIWAGAHGVMVEPEAPDPIGAQVLITSDREKCEWLTFDIPDELRRWIKSSFSCEIENALRVAPNPLENWAGWLVATGKDLYEVIDNLKERKEMLPEGFDCDISSLCDLISELKEADGKGVHIADGPLPKPQDVIDD